MSTLFNGIFDTGVVQTISVENFLLCLGVSLVLGLVMASVYMWRNEHSKSFVVTLALLPAVVCVVIMMVNGNIGTGVAVAGAFSLVRFRSVPGTAKEICMLFLAMGAGLICGMGYLGYAVLFTLIAPALFNFSIALTITDSYFSIISSLGVLSTTSHKNPTIFCSTNIPPHI